MSHSTTQMADAGLTIAIDFDGTLARDPRLFGMLIRTMIAQGHQPILVTGRAMGTPHEADVRAVMAQMPDAIPMVFAGPQWKRQAAQEAGFAVDIWIDDMPEYIGPQDLDHPAAGVKHRRPNS